ncbi:MAG: TonB-dependent receptor [Phenylobacterium sp.]
MTGIRAARRAPLACAGRLAAGLAVGPALADDAAVATVAPVDVKGGRTAVTDVKQTAAPLNNPQTVTVVPKAVIEAQNLLTLRDVLSTVPGITFGAGEGGGGFGDSINLRGYSANNDITIDGVRDSAQYSRSDPFNVEQIEVYNGANSVYSGSGSVGGTINLVSKRPFARNATTVEAGVGTDDYWRATVDSNVLVGDNVAVRLNAMAHTNDAPGRKVEAFERWGFAPSVAIGIGGPTRFTAMYFHQEDSNTPQYGVPFYNGRPVPGVDPENYYGYANLDKQDQQIDIVTGILDHEFSDALSVRNLTRWQRVEQQIVVDPPQGVYCLANGLKPVAWSQSTTATNISGYAPCTAGDPAPGFYAPAGPRGNLRETENTLLYNQTDLTWEFDTAGWLHTLVVGAAFTAETFELKNGAIVRNANGTTPALPQMNIASPDVIYRGPLNYIPGGAGAPNATTGFFPAGFTDGDRSNQAVYLFDNVEFNADWSLNFGLRWEHNEVEHINAYYTSAGFLPNPAGGPRPGPAQAGAPGGVFSGWGPLLKSDDNLFSYRVGLVYKPVPNASLYVAYANSRTPSTSTVNGSGACSTATCNVKPDEAENIEVGGKWDYRGRLSLTAALFRNDRTNYRVPSGDPAVPFEVLDGSARVQGVALGASGLVTDRWAVFANYTYLDSEVLQGASAASAARGLDFTRGDPLTNTPDHAFSLFTTYDVSDRLQLGYGVTYQGEYYLTQHAQITGSNPPARTTIPLVTAEAYWVHRAVVTFRPRERVELRLNVNNLFDEVYYTRGRNNGWATPGDGRSATLTASYRF